MPDELRRRTVARLHGAARKANYQRSLEGKRLLSKLGLAGWIAAVAAVVGAGYLAYQLHDLSSRTILIGPLMELTPVEIATDDTTVSYRLAHEDESVSVWLDAASPAHPGRGARIVWSDNLQAGLLQVHDLAPNDATKVQYQVWIVDADRPADSARVPAGLFNVRDQDGSAGKTLIVRPVLPVGRAVEFAVTKEPAGGSLVSDWGDRLVLHAAVPDDESLAMY